MYKNGPLKTALVCPKNNFWGKPVIINHKTKIQKFYIIYFNKRLNVRLYLSEAIDKPLELL